MQVRGVVRISLALFLGIAALVLHLMAICSPRWKITKRDLPPAMTPVSYGLWERCEYTSVSIMKQGVALGTRHNVHVCRPNRYMRYSVENFDTCYYVRRNCPVVEPGNLPKGCSCRYLPSTKGLQWLTILAAVFLSIGLLLLYVKLVTSSQKDTVVFALSYGPFICFVLTLLLMVTTLLLLGSYLRRDTYEDYSFPLATISNDTTHAHGFDLFSLRSYAKHYASTFPKDRYVAAEKELRATSNTHYHTVIGRATIFEIIATILICIVTAITFLLGASSRAADI